MNADSRTAAHQLDLAVIIVVSVFAIVAIARAPRKGTGLTGRSGLIRFCTVRAGVLVLISHKRP